MTKHHFRFTNGMWLCCIPAAWGDECAGHTAAGETPIEAYCHWLKILSDKRRARMERDHWEMRMGIGRYAHTRIGLYQHLPKTSVKRPKSRWWKRLFCIHDWQHSHVTDRDHLGRAYSVWRCRKCDKHYDLPIKVAGDYGNQK